MFQQIGGIILGRPLWIAMPYIFMGFQKEKLFKIMNILLYRARNIGYILLMFSSRLYKRRFFKNLIN